MHYIARLQHCILLEVVPASQNSTMTPSSRCKCSRVLLYRQVRMNVVTQNGEKSIGGQTSRRSDKMAVWKTAVLAVMMVKARWWRWNSETEMCPPILYIRGLCCTWEWTLFLFTLWCEWETFITWSKRLCLPLALSNYLSCHCAHVTWLHVPLKHWCPPVRLPGCW